MTPDTLSTAVRRFVDYFGELGPRWGLPANACRVHAYLYVKAKPVDEKSLASVLHMDAPTLADAMEFLSEYRMVSKTPPSTWQVSGDPWEMLIAGLNERRQRELPDALATLQQCRVDAIAGPTSDRVAANQISKMLQLVESLGALDSQVRRLPPSLLRGIVSISGRAARIMDASFAPKRRSN